MVHINHVLGLEDASLANVCVECDLFLANDPHQSVLRCGVSNRLVVPINAHILVVTMRIERALTERAHVLAGFDNRLDDVCAS